MTQFLAVAAGGAIGSVARFWLSHTINAVAGRGFPYGTLAVNVAGCLLMGLLFVVFERASQPVLRIGVLVGVLGGFTTFSAFSIETLQLMQQAQWAKAATYVTLSVGVCLAATALGVVIARQW